MKKEKVEQDRVEQEKVEQEKVEQEKVEQEEELEEEGKGRSHNIIWKLQLLSSSLSECTP